MALDFVVLNPQGVYLRAQAPCGGGQRCTARTVRPATPAGCFWIDKVTELIALDFPTRLEWGTRLPANYVALSGCQVSFSRISGEICRLGDAAVRVGTNFTLFRLQGTERAGGY